MGFFWVLGSVYGIFVGSQALLLYTFYVLRGALRFFFIHTRLLIKKNKCMEFFHKVADSNRGKNSIDSLLIGGTISSNRLENNEHIIQLNKNLYS